MCAKGTSAADGEGVEFDLTEVRRAAIFGGMRLLLWKVSSPKKAGPGFGTALLSVLFLGGALFTYGLRAGPGAASELATIRAEYKQTAAAIKAGDLRVLSLEFDRVLPGSGPQRAQARFYFDEGYAEDGPGNPEYRANLRKVEVRFNFAAREYRREVLLINARPRFVFLVGADETPAAERRFYFSARGKAVHRIYGPAGAKAKALDARDFSAADRQAAAAALKLARDYAGLFARALALPDG